MGYQTKCLNCGFTWLPKKWDAFFSFCTECQKLWLEEMEKQFTPKYLPKKEKWR